MEPITWILPLESSGLIRLASIDCRQTPPCTDNGVDFINKQDAVGILLQLFEQRFKAFFKIATIFGPCQQRPMSSE